MQNEITSWYIKLMVTLGVFGQVFASCLFYCPEDSKYLLGYILLHTILVFNTFT